MFVWSATSLSLEVTKPQYAQSLLASLETSLLGRCAMQKGSETRDQGEGRNVKSEPEYHCACTKTSCYDASGPSKLELQSSGPDQQDGPTGKCISLYSSQSGIWPSSHGSGSKAYVGGTPYLLSGLPPFASPAGYHCTNTTLLGGSTAAAAITLGPRLRLRLPKQLLKLAVCWLLQPEKRAVSPFQRCQDRGKTVHLAKSLFCHSATSIFERISTSIMASRQRF